MLSPIVALFSALALAGFEEPQHQQSETGDENQPFLMEEAEPFAPNGKNSKPDTIIHGEDAAIDQYPMTGGLIADAYVEFGEMFSGDIRMLMCSSTLIAPDVVLTAAHCIAADSMGAEFGVTVEDAALHWSRQTDLSSYGFGAVADLPEDTVSAWDWVFPEGWDLTGMGMGLTENKDIGLIFLEEAVFDVPYATLPTVEEALQIQEGNEVTIVGWGQQTADQQPPAGTVGLKQWGTSFINEVADAEFQVGATSSDTRKCHGDSGGPTFMTVKTDSTETQRLIGVTSHASDETDCAAKGGVDTRVDYYLTWIDEQMRSRCEDGTRVWCEVEGILPPPTEEESKGGCGCASQRSPTAAGIWGLLALALLGLRRRNFPSQQA